MKRPYKYTVFCNKTGDVVEETNYMPSAHRLKTWEETENPNVRVEKVTRTVYEDMRYEAKLRLYEYLQKKKAINE